jgi:hypothetical protein
VTLKGCGSSPQCPERCLSLRHRGHSCAKHACQRRSSLWALGLGASPVSFFRYRPMRRLFLVAVQGSSKWTIRSCSCCCERCSVGQACSPQNSISVICDRLPPSDMSLQTSSKPSNSCRCRFISTQASSPPILGTDPNMIQDDFDPYNFDVDQYLSFDFKV